LVVRKTCCLFLPFLLGVSVGQKKGFLFFYHPRGGGVFFKWGFSYAVWVSFSGVFALFFFWFGVSFLEKGPTVFPLSLPPPNFDGSLLFLGTQGGVFGWRGATPLFGSFPKTNPLFCHPRGNPGAVLAGFLWVLLVFPFFPFFFFPG